MQLVKVLYCKLPTNSKQLPGFPLEVVPGTKPQSQRWEARVLPTLPPWPLVIIIIIIIFFQPDERLGFNRENTCCSSVNGQTRSCEQLHTNTHTQTYSKHRNVCIQINRLHMPLVLPLPLDSHSEI